MKRPLSDFTNKRVLVSPSLLAADFAALGEELRRIESANADMLHLDVMDAHFVPNLTIGPALISALRKHSSLPFDTHLMMTHPLRYVKAFSDAGADHITFHIECSEDPAELIRAIRATGCSAGVSLKPGTPASALLPVIADLDLVLVMTVEPGFGGQSFMTDMLPKIAEIRRMLDSISSRAHLEVDGGIGAGNVEEVVSAGANVLVAGTSVFRSPAGAAEAIEELHAAQKILNSSRVSASSASSLS